MQILKDNQRICRKCNEIITYSSIRSKKNADRNKSLCRRCAGKKHDNRHKCPECNKLIQYKSKSSLYRAISKRSICRTCANRKRAIDSWKNDNYRQVITHKSNNPSFETIEKLSKSTKRLWENEEYRNNIKQSAIDRWNTLSYREKMMAIYSSDEYRKANSRKIREKWNDAEYRRKVTESCRKAALSDEAVERSRKAAIKQWADPEFRNKMQRILAAQPKVSSIQNALYSILDDLGINYYREYNDREDDSQCRIGPYSFDCVIPLDNYTLLIECQGNYWHSLPRARQIDKAKKSYIENNFPNYRLKYLWEHEFYDLDKVVELVKYWTGADFIVNDFDFGDVKIKKCKSHDYREFLLKYHYLSNAGRGGKSFGAFLDDKLIAVAIFSPLPRQNISIDAVELSRFCIHPAYQKRNFGSWFLSRVVKHIDDNVLAYADTTFNHTGSIYKACGFEFIGKTNPDYWYVDESGWMMHKKTLYNRAKNLGMTESEFSRSFGYVKIYGSHKLRFLLRK